MKTPLCHSSALFRVPSGDSLARLSDKPLIYKKSSTPRSTQRRGGAHSLAASAKLPSLPYPFSKSHTVAPFRMFPISNGLYDSSMRNRIETMLHKAEEDRFQRISTGRASLSKAALEALEEDEFEGFHYWWKPQAIHEAGHAVVAFVLGFTPRVIKVNSFFCGKAHSRYENCQERLLWKKLPPQERDECLKCEVSWLAGGLVAQAILLPPPLDSGAARADFRDACKRCMTLIESESTRDERGQMLNAILRQATLRAEEIVSENREAILSLAAESVSASALSGRRILEILASHGVERRQNGWPCLLG